MGYKGSTCNLLMGNGGLHTDDPQNKTPPTDLITALNIQFYNGLIEKMAGSTAFNSTPLSSGVAGIFDWWPDDLTQRLIAGCKNGKIYRYRLGGLPATEVLPSDTSPATLTLDSQMFFVSGGHEVTSNPRKLFIFSQSAPQVIDGDGTTRRAMSAPALDWTGPNQPTFGAIHRSRQIVFGNRNNPHTAYLSAATNHEDFTSINSVTIPCFSGDAERLMSGVVYKGAFFAIKYPFGVYQLIDADPDANNWYFNKINAELGATSAHAIASIINDVFIANTNGSISSATSTLNFGNLRTGEVLYLLRNENYMREETKQASLANRHCVYYSDKKMFMATYQSAGGIQNDRILCIDMNDQNAFKTSWSTKDQPNCLAMRKDNLGVSRPMYGAEDGTIYLMDRSDRKVGSADYNFEFQTPHMDMGHLDPRVADTNKFFEFLEVDFEASGDFILYIDVLINGRLMKTMEFPQSGSSNLDSFILDQNQTDSDMSRALRKTVGLSGRRISLRGYGQAIGENVRIAAFNLYFRLSAQQQDGEDSQ